MKKLPFKHSAVGTIGIELELQIIDPHTYGLSSRAKDLIRKIKQSPYKDWIKPEITQSMIEINSSIHHVSHNILAEFLDIQSYLLDEAQHLNIQLSGGGTHPFQKWSIQKIFPTVRFKNLSRQYRYLSKRATVFGQHVHVGCGNAEDALYLTHALARYVPQLIALSASSPFYQGIDTGYSSSRINIFSAFPLSGVVPYLLNWKEFSDYFYKMRNFGIIKNMKDFYWDIRPKPEFGTVEVRVCDTPLTIKKCIMLAAYIQTLAYYLLLEKPFAISQDLYFLYNYNRFQASRYGFDGTFINPDNYQHRSIHEDILNTIELIQPHSIYLHNNDFISQLQEDVTNKVNDASELRKIMKKVESFPKLIHEQCKLWANTY